MKTKFLLLIAFTFVSFFSFSQIRYLAGVLSGSQAGTTSMGSGVVIVKYNMATKLLEHYGNFRGLTGNRSNQHIHTGAPGVAGVVSVSLTGTGATEGTLTGSATLDATKEADLLAGNMYTNVHSSTAGGGEVRAQLIPTTDGQTEFISARLQGAQSTPPNGSLGAGSVNALVDKSTNMLYLTGSFSGLTNAASGAHIHLGAANVSGGVIVSLIFTATTTGTLDTARVITPTNVSDILSGNTYVNIHSTPTYGAGEIRGQLTQLNQMMFFANALEGSQEFPVNASTAKGTVIVKYNSVSKLLELTGDYQNLNATISGSHIHGPADPGVNAGVIFTLTNTAGTIGTLSGSFTLDATQEANLLAGKMYVNVHSTGTYGGGEIRAQLLMTSMGESQYFTPLLQVSQNVSLVTSSGSGSAVVLLDKMTNKVYTTGSFTNLTSNVSNSHIHGGAAGTNGGVAVGLTYAGTTSGTITGTATVRPTFADSMIRGLSYINIHSVNNTGGEIRGQLGDLVLPIKLSYFNGYKDRNNISLIWESAQEIDLLNYEVEQQDPVTKRWITKTSVKAKGGDLTTKYNVSDIPNTGSEPYVIYRLKMIDKNGSFNYSNAVRINFKKSAAELTLLSNPVVNGSVRYTISGLSTNKNAEVSVVDFNGRLMIKTIQPSLSTNDINLAGLAPGMYKLVVKIDGVVLQKSFLK